MIRANIPVRQNISEERIFKFVFLPPQLTRCDYMGMIEIPAAKIQPKIERIGGPRRQASSRQDIVIQLFRENVRSQE